MHACACRILAGAQLMQGVLERQLLHWWSKEFLLIAHAFWTNLDYPWFEQHPPGYTRPPGRLYLFTASQRVVVHLASNGRDMCAKKKCLEQRLNICERLHVCALFNSLRRYKHVVSMISTKFYCSQLYITSVLSNYVHKLKSLSSVHYPVALTGPYRPILKFRIRAGLCVTYYCTQ